MLLLNFSHPLTETQIEQAERLSGRKIAQVINVKVQVEAAPALAAQIIALVNRAGLTPQQWQNEPILINPPALSFVAVVLLAELHGRMGYFPPCLRLRPLTGSLPPQFEVAELLDLNAIREQARQRR